MARRQSPSLEIKTDERPSQSWQYLLYEQHSLVFYEQPLCKRLLFRSKLYDRREGATTLSMEIPKKY